MAPQPPRPMLPRQPDSEASLPQLTPSQADDLLVTPRRCAGNEAASSCIDDLCCALRMQVQTVRRSLSWASYHHRTAQDKQDNTLAQLLTLIDDFQKTQLELAHLSTETGKPKDVATDGQHQGESSGCPQLMMNHLGDWMTRNEQLMRQLLEKQHPATVNGDKAVTAEASAPMQKRKSTSPKKQESTTNSRRNLTTVSVRWDQEESERKLMAEAIMEKEESLEPAIELPPWRQKLQNLVNSHTFELVLGIAIATNAIFLGAEVDYRATAAGADIPIALTVIRHSYNALFFFELILRAFAEGCPGYLCSHSWAWNYLDLFLVLSSFVEVAFELLQSAKADGDNSAGASMSNVRAIRMFRLTRLVRIVRITRIVRFVRALRTLVYSIVCTLKSLVWSMVLLVIIIYVFAIMFTQAVCDYLLDGEADVTVQASELLTRYWGSLPTSMFTLFKSIANGVSWDDVVRELDFFWLWPALFTTFIAFAYFAVLNVVTGVFCQSAIESAQHDHDMIISAMAANKGAYEKRARELFECIDADRSGELTIKELEKHLTHPDVKDYFRSLEIEPEDAWTLFKLIDVDETNVVDLQEFVMGCIRLKGNARSIDVAKIMYDQKGISSRLNDLMLAVADIVDRDEDESVGTDDLAKG